MPGGVKLEILQRIAFANGHSFGDAGPFEMIVARADYMVDPRHPENQTITDISLAPIGSDGLIHYSGDVEILRPVDPKRGNRRIFFEFVNRGNRRLLQFFGDAPQTNEIRKLEDAGDGFLLTRGYTLVWSAWQGDNLPGNQRLLLDLPVAMEGGKPVTGRITSEFFVERSGIFTLPLSGFVSTRSHPTVSMDTRQAVLTKRRYAGSEREVIPPDQWAFARYFGSGPPTPNVVEGGLIDEQVIVPSPTDLFIHEGFKPGWIYELLYTASSPQVLALGYAGVRDLISFLRYDRSAANPLHAEGAEIEKAYAWGRSQSGRAIRDYIYRGFNGDTSGRRVFDGMLPHIAGSGRLDMNRFGNLVISSSRRWENHYNPADRFPFAYPLTTDHLTGKTDGILKRPATDPLVIHSHTSSEYWYRRASLVHTDTRGNDLPEPANVRIYHWSSSQHWANPIIPKPTRGSGFYYLNIVTTSLLFRPLVDMIDAWATKGIAPPPSRHPRRSDDTLLSYDEWLKQFPKIPGIYLPAGTNELENLDFGPRADQGIHDILPPKIVGTEKYAVLVPSVDEDGNEVAGVRAQMVVAPLGTYTGWNIRDREHGFGATYNFWGAYIPFPDTEDERQELRDPRRSIIGRYRSPEGYQKAIEAAAKDLVSQGFMLADDVPKAVAEAKNWNRPRHDVRL